MDDSSRCDDCGALTSVDELGGEEGEWLYPSCLWAWGERAAANLPPAGRPDPKPGSNRPYSPVPAQTDRRPGP